MKPYINVEPVNSKREKAGPDWEFRKFISNAKMFLKAGEVVVLYSKEQLETLQEYFGDELISNYNDVSNYWACYLKHGRR